MNEFDAHESSYDHQHKKRLKDMKEMQRQVQSSNKKEEKGPLMSIKLGGAKSAGDKKETSGSAGFKKGGFKNAFASVSGDADGEVKKESDMKKDRAAVTEEEADSDMTDDDDYYDPRKPTDCMPNCKSQAITSIA